MQSEKTNTCKLYKEENGNEVNGSEFQQLASLAFASLLLKLPNDHVNGEKKFLKLHVGTQKQTEAK